MVNTVIVKFCTAKQQSAAFKQLPWQTEEPAAPAGCSHSSFLQHPQKDHQKDLWSAIKSSQPAAQEGCPWSIGQETRAGSPIDNCVRPLKHTGLSLCCLKESVLLISQVLASTKTAVHLYMLYDKLLSHAPCSFAFGTRVKPQSACQRCCSFGRPCLSRISLQLSHLRALNKSLLQKEVKDYFIPLLTISWTSSVSDLRWVWYLEVDYLSRHRSPGERLHPQTMSLIWENFDGLI